MHKLSGYSLPLLCVRGSGDAIYRDGGRVHCKALPGLYLRGLDNHLKMGCIVQWIIKRGDKRGGERGGETALLGCKELA